MKGPDRDVVWGDGLGIADKHALAIPQLKTLEKRLALRKQRMSLCNRLAVRESAEFLDGLNMAAAHEMASHDEAPTMDERVRAFPSNETRVRSQSSTSMMAGTLSASGLRT
jgi:hypothetical protein